MRRKPVIPSEGSVNFGSLLWMKMREAPWSAVRRGGTPPFYTKPLMGDNGARLSGLV